LFYAPLLVYKYSSWEMSKIVCNLVQIDTTGLGIVVLDYLMDREWVAEEQLTNDLGQHHKITRRALKYLEHVSWCQQPWVLPANVKRPHVSGFAPQATCDLRGLFNQLPMPDRSTSSWVSTGAKPSEPRRMTL
jgi:hypothetical protein